MNEHIQKIASDPLPECEVEGHRVHVTMNRTGEMWPKWCCHAYGIAGGFIHFEQEQDYQDWLACQNPDEDNDVEVRKVEDARAGRCVSECGPIGFFKAA